MHKYLKFGSIIKYYDFFLVPRGVLNDNYAIPAEPDEPPKENSVLPNEFFEDDYFSKEEHPAPKLHRNLTHPSNIQLVPSVITVTPPVGGNSNEIAYRTEGRRNPKKPIS